MSELDDLEKKPRNALVTEIIELRADRSFLLDHADELTEELAACELLAEKKEDTGVVNVPSLTVLLLALATGAIVGMAID